MTPSSIAAAAEALLDWVANSNPSFARVDYQSEAAQKAVWAAVQRSLPNAVEIRLPLGLSAKTLGAYLRSVLAEQSPGVVSLVWTPGVVSSSDKHSGRDLEFALSTVSLLRESLADFPLHQIWWMNEEFSARFVQAVPDLESWFLLRLNLPSALTPPRPKVPVLDAASTADPISARSQAAILVDQATRAFAARQPVQDVWAKLIEPAMRLLRDASLNAEAAAIERQFMPSLSGLPWAPQTGSGRFDYFISYNKADRPWAEWIASELEAAGQRTCIQSWDFLLGSNFVLEMQRAASQSGRTIAVLSPSYLASEFTQPEWAAAFAQDPTGNQRRLLPLRVQPCKPQGLLKAIVYCDLVGLDEAAARQALLQAIKPKRPTAGAVPFPTTKPKPTFPGALPARWNILGTRNPNYQDRDGLLARLADSLRKGQTAALTQALAGLGGIGKSTLAREYAFTYSADYDTIWWIGAEQEATLVPDLAKLARAAQVADADTLDKDAALAALAWLRTQTRWLLIFDDATDAEALAPWLPGGPVGHILITSRSPNWRGLGQSLTLATFTPKEGADFLAQRTGIGTEPAAAHALSDAVGGLPLALEIAAKYIEQTRSSIADYLDLLNQHDAKLMSRVTATFQISIDQLSPQSRRLLQELSYLAPEDVPCSLFNQDQFVFNDALAGLIAYSLVQKKDDGLFTHRLVQAVIRRDEDTVLPDLINKVNAAFSYAEHDLATWAISSRLYPHVLALIEHLVAARVESATMSRLLNQAADYARNIRSDFAAALSLLQRALKIDEKVYGLDHPNVARDANNIGQILLGQGDLAGALTYTKRALEIDEKAYGLDHPSVAIDANNIGAILLGQGDLAGALFYTKRALEIDEKAYGFDHPSVAIDANNLGQILLGQDDLASALFYTKRALEIDETFYGLDHPNVGFRANNIGGILQRQGDLAGARTYFQRALAIFHQTVGPDHPSTRTAAANLAKLL